MAESSFWNDAEKAKKNIAECNELKSWTVAAVSLKNRFEDVKALLPEAEALNDEALLNDLSDELIKIDEGLGELEIRKMLSGELDTKNCYLSINSGAGGTEACDWALMLSRMY